MDIFTLQEVVRRTGLSEHTLRYYEQIGLLDKVERDRSSGHRRYTADDLRVIEAMACLRATGMSIDDMRRYRELHMQGAAGAAEQIELFEAHRQKLEIEIARKQEHLRYLEMKVAFWEAVAAGDEAKMYEIGMFTSEMMKRIGKEDLESAVAEMSRK
jgi:DNA-binding transcriptional MerR regulator